MVWVIKLWILLLFGGGRFRIAALCVVRVEIFGLIMSSAFCDATCFRIDLNLIFGENIPV